jgi:hypothetical protein
MKAILIILLWFQGQKQRTRAIEFMKSIFKNVDCILTPGKHLSFLLFKNQWHM